MRTFELSRGKGYPDVITVEAENYSTDLLNRETLVVFYSTVGQKKQAVPTFGGTSVEVERDINEPTATYTVRKGWHCREIVSSIMSDVDAILRGAIE